MSKAHKSNKHVVSIIKTHSKSLCTYIRDEKSKHILTRPSTRYAVKTGIVAPIFNLFKLFDYVFLLTPIHDLMTEDMPRFCVGQNIHLIGDRKFFQDCYTWRCPEKHLPCLSRPTRRRDQGFIDYPENGYYIAKLSPKMLEIVESLNSTIIENNEQLWKMSTSVFNQLSVNQRNFFLHRRAQFNQPTWATLDNGRSQLNHEHNHVKNACVPPGNDNGDLSTECLSYLVKKYSKLDLGHELVFTKVMKQNLRHRQSVASFFRSEDVAKNDRRFILFGWQAYPKSQQEPKTPMPPHWTAVKKINDKMMIIDDRYLSSGVIKPLEADEMGSSLELSFLSSSACKLIAPKT